MDLNDVEQRMDLCRNRVIPLIKRAASERIHTPYQIEKKGQGNFVTTVDKEIEAELIRGLSEILPEAGFAAEEGNSSIRPAYNWVIDPIDGTSNFINGFPYAVSAALTLASPENVLLGVVYDPADDTVYFGCKDAGSYVVENGTEKRLHVREFPKDEGVSIFGMPYNREKTAKIFETAQKYYAVSSDLKRIGPASLDICRVASGKAKTYFELDLKEWDIAAGLLILTEAGGFYKREEDLFIFSAAEI